MHVLNVFKYLYNKEYEEQNLKRRKTNKFNLEQPLNNFLIKIEERKLREEEFLIQLWLKVNPVNEENVDSHIV